MDFIEACKQIIGIDSTPNNGTGEVTLFVQELAQGMGFQVQREEEVQKGMIEANVICFPDRPHARVHLMLQTHLDTVDPGSFALWEHNERNPFRAAIHQGSIYGLGASDTKLDFLCKLYAAQKFIGHPPKKSFAVVGTYGEEYNMNGAIRLIRHKTLLADRVVVSEPSEFNLVYAGKGLANIEITIPISPEELQARQAHDLSLGQSTQSRIFKGRATHSSQPQLGENAIDKLMAYLGQLPDQILLIEADGGTNYNTVPVQAVLEFDLVSLPVTTVNQKLLGLYNKIIQLKNEFDQHKDLRFDPAMTTINIGMIRTYSDHVKVMGCVRWPEGLTENTYSGWMSVLKDYCAQLGATFVVRDYKKPFYVQPDIDFVCQAHTEICREVPNSKLTTQPVTNEANVFHKLGIETIAFGPGRREGNSQTPTESIGIDNLHKAIKIYQNLIEKFCY
jgi:acetylornithine deacetylase/succinyl-diaminopimelate desuccinylase-like protein